RLAVAPAPASELRRRRARAAIEQVHAARAALVIAAHHALEQLSVPRRARELDESVEGVAPVEVEALEAPRNLAADEGEPGRVSEAVTDLRLARDRAHVSLPRAHRRRLRSILGDRHDGDPRVARAQRGVEDGRE